MNLALKWKQLIDDPFFQNVPYKVELNKFGQILMSPASNRYGILQFKVSCAIERSRKGGVLISRCSILTSEGVRVADVGWASKKFFSEFGEITPYPKAPEICVEMKSSANSKVETEEKIRLYLEKGALEVWIIETSGEVNFYSHIGRIKKSNLVEDFNL